MVAFSQSDVNPRFANLRTLKMLKNGTLGPVLGSYTFGAKEVYDHCLLKISDNITALVYRDNQDRGVIKIIKVTENGTKIISDTVNGSLIFDSWNCYEPSITPISANKYAIVYGGNNSFGYLKTVEISSIGIVSDQVIDTFIFDSINRTYTPQILPISGNIFAIAYRGDTKNGILSTVEISDEGIITDGVVDDLLYEDDYADLPKIIHMYDDIYLITYQSDQTDGYIVEVSISSNGSISDSFLAKYKFNTGNNYHGMEPDIIRVENDIYGVAFRSGSQQSTPHEGHLNTYKLHSYNQDSNTITNKNGIIVKEDVYRIYVNSTHISVSIGSHNIIKELSLSVNDWNHIVLTYDGSYIRLYCNGTEVITEYYDMGIPRNINDIRIGDKFFGYIDEVYIYSRILSLSEIQNRYNVLKGL
jgi:hypothetical protein